MRTSPILVIFIGFFISQSSLASPSSSRFAHSPSSLEQTVKASLKFSAEENEPLAGLSLAIYARGKPIFVKGFGLADVQKKIPVKKDTVFRVGSITKQFTAAAILLLEEQNKLKVTDAVRDLLPAYPGIPEGVTIEHLLGHTSGIFNYTRLPNWQDLQKRPMTRPELVGLFLKQPLDFKPGEGWSYSNSGYYLLGLVIEKISGMSYQDFIQKHLISQAKLQRTGYCPAGIETKNMAKGYLLENGQWRDAPALNMDHPYAAGGLCSTAEDLALWATALMRGDIIRQQSLKRMTTPVLRKDRKKTSNIEVGWGFMMSEEMGHRFVGSGGAIDGFINTLDTYPDDELVVVSLANTESNAQIMLAITLARSMLGLIQDEPVAADVGHALAGIYRQPDSDAAFSVRWKKGQLLWTRMEKSKPMGPALRMLAQDEKRFIISENSALVRFEWVEGKVKGSSMLIMGDEQTFVKD